MTYRIISCLLFVFLLASCLCCQAAAETNAPIKFDWPSSCTLGQSCWIVHYVDDDPSGTSARDFTCGDMTVEGQNSLDIAIKDYKSIADNIAALAPADGVVLRIRDDMADSNGTPQELDAAHKAKKDCGNGVVLDHGNGWETFYCHLKHGSINVTQGQHVRAGDRLGSIGMSGAVNFAHLNFGIKHNGQSIDPFTGQPPIVGCGLENPAPLWRTPVAYDTLMPYAAGFSDQPPEMDKLTKDTSSPMHIAANASFLYFWVLTYGVEPGDHINLQIFGSDGKVFVQKEFIQNKKEILNMASISSDAQNYALRPGIYTGKATLTRHDGHVHTIESTVEVDAAPSAAAEIQQGMVGLRISDTEAGVRIGDVVSGSPAAIAGITPSDTILKIDDIPVSGMKSAEIVPRLRGPVGSKVKLTYVQNGAPPDQAKDVTLVREKIDLPVLPPGLQLVTLEPPHDGIGLGINNPDISGGADIWLVAYDSPAYKADIRVRDTLLKVDDIPVSSMKIQEIQKKLEGPVGTKVKLTYLPKSGLPDQVREVTLAVEHIKGQYLARMKKDDVGKGKLEIVGTRAELSPPQAICAADFYICPDGAKVPRTGEACTFSACPASTAQPQQSDKKVSGLTGLTGEIKRTTSPNELRYKMTVTVTTPEGEKTGSSVWQASTYTEPSILPEQGGRFYSPAKGEAVAVDLGQRGMLFATMQDIVANPTGADYASRLVDDFFPQWGKTPAGTKIEIGLQHYPQLIHFRNIDDPTTVEKAMGVGAGWKVIDHMEDIFGKGVKLKDITLEATNDPVTTGIERYLPWLPARSLLPGYFSGTEIIPADQTRTWVTSEHFISGLPIDQTAAMNWLKQKAELGNPQAQLWLGMLYNNNWVWQKKISDVKYDREKAKKWFSKAAEQGYVEAEMSLARLNLSDPWGKNGNTKEALSWYKKAVDQGNYDAAAWMARIYYDGQAAGEPDGIKTDYQQALFWYLVAKKSGRYFSFIQDNKFDGSAAGHLSPEQVANIRKQADEWRPGGSMGYQTSRNIPANKNTQPSETAATQDHPEISDPLSDRLKAGLAAKAAGNIPTAVSLLLPVADQGDASAQEALGEIHEKLVIDNNGYHSLEPDYPLAMKWYQKAAGQGNTEAQGKIGALYENGEGVAVDYTEAMKWLRKAADQDNADAQLEIGIMYYKGNGVQQDYQEAYFWCGLALASNPQLNRFYFDEAAVHLTPDQKAAIAKRIQDWKPATIPNGMMPKP